jgi:hypothetical protein
LPRSARTAAPYEIVEDTIGGFDYRYIVVADAGGTVTWAIANGFKSFAVGGLNCDPKLHLKCRLDPLDLYVKHTSPLLNALLIPAAFDGDSCNPSP